MKADLEERITFYKSLLREQHHSARHMFKKKARQASTTLGEPALLPQQVGLLLYLLGMGKDDAIVNKPLTKKRAEKTAFPRYRNDWAYRHMQDAEVELPHQGFVKPQHRNVAYKQSVVETVSEELGDKGKLEYSAERFARALEIV